MAHQIRSNQSPILIAICQDFNVRAFVLLSLLLACSAFAEEKPFYLTIEAPPAPELSPEEAFASFRIADGFEIELVASEPLVEDPVAVTWDEYGVLYVVEMRGFMPDVYGNGEDEPVGAVVRLLDDDNDGRMDRREVMLDNLVLPRAVAVVNEGLLIGEPPNLWLCPSKDADAKTIDCENKRKILNYGDQPGSVEHAENGLITGVDNWLYSAKSERRLRLVDGEIEVEPTFFRGQWGITQDDDGRLFYNTNSNFLFGDSYDAQPVTAAGIRQAPGLSARVSQKDEVFASRVNPGVNRAYVPGVLREDGRLKSPTSASGMTVYRGGQFGEAHLNDVFVAEPAANAIVQLRLVRDGLSQTAEHILYPNDEWGSVEFMTSTDERYRPVDVKVGPDGALYIVDMYRGIIQDHVFLSDELRAQALERSLDKPLGMGRIWRVTKTNAPVQDVPSALLDQLDHPNGWVRDTAQRRLLVSNDSDRSLRNLAREGSEQQRVHALWTLEGRDALTKRVVRGALEDESSRVRLAALRAGRNLLSAKNLLAQIETDSDVLVRHHALMYLADHNQDPEVIRFLAANLDADPYKLVAVQAASVGAEIELLSALEWSEEQETKTKLLEKFAQQYLHTSADQAGRLLNHIAVQPDWAATSLLKGILEVSRQPNFERFLLSSPHPLFAATKPQIQDAISGARRAFTWQGDELAANAKPLTDAQTERKQAGQAYYESRCATCHGADGKGVSPIGPVLVESPYVIGPPETLIRIMLDGLSGPIEVNGESWNAVMPGHRMNPDFSDEVASGVATYVRRAWGHGASAVDPEQVAKLKSERTGGLWTVATLEAESINHNYEAYVGNYANQLQFSYDGRDLLISSVYFNGVMSETKEDHFHFKPRALDVEFIWECGVVTGARMRMETGGVVLPKMPPKEMPPKEIPPKQPSEDQ